MSAPPVDNIRQLRRPESAVGGVNGRRVQTDWPAELTCPAGRVACTVLDVSSRGARLVVVEAPAEGTRVWLVVETIGSIAAQVIWKRDNQIGIRFSEMQSWIGRLQPLQQQQGTGWRP